jgi:hypothetical protein
MAATVSAAEQAVSAMDALVSGLLDIEDDINEAVVWLAENWSADLPAVTWHTSAGRQDTDGDALRLVVDCDPAELVRVAELLEATPVDDPGDSHDGSWYRHVRRSFGSGRVELYAFTDVAPETDQ